MMHLNRLSRTTAAAFLALCLTAGAGAEEPGLEDVGVALEKARQLDPTTRITAMREVSSMMKQVMDQGVARDDKIAARFLSGEIRFELGEFEKAEENYKKATKDPGKNPFSDDAALARITAIEAMGDDEQADKAWQDWEEDYPESPLRAEVRLARAWNALRRNNPTRANRILLTIPAEHAWMEEDTRYLLAVATTRYLEGQPAEALAALERGGDGPGETYLSALCLIAEGDVLKAAARFQDTAERFPHSPLRDHAMLAKANTFMTGGAYRSAAEEFARVVELASRPEVRAEAELRHAASLYLAGDTEAGRESLQQVAAEHFGTAVAARAQFLLGEVLLAQSDFEGAILEFNRVLTDYFEHELASSAQYRVGQCLDELGRENEATSTYQAVVSGYSQSSEAPAAAYLAGVGLMAQNRYLPAVPYFQLVVDRYARSDSSGALDFATPEHQELVEASLCLLALSYHRSGNLGQLSGMPHLMLTRMPASTSTWRAHALLIDADALAAQGRYEESQQMLEQLITEFPDHRVAVHANRLLAWTYARQGQDDLAIETEKQMLARYAADGNVSHLASAYLNKAHVLFNGKDYRQAVAAYEDFLNRFPGHEDHLLALYQAGICHIRLDQAGNAADSWEALVALDPTAEIAEKAWLRVADLYFQAEHYEDARRCYQGLVDNFSGSTATANSLLRMAQCEYNSGNDAEALDGFSALAARFPGTPQSREAERGIEMALYRLGQGEDGAEVLAELVERYPTSSFAADAQFQVAMHLYQDEDYLAAADEFRRVVSQFPGYSGADQAYFLMGDAYAQSGLQDEARASYEQFMMFFGDSDLRSTVQFRLGAIRFEEGDYMRAAIDFTSVLDADPPEEIAAASRFNLALCHRMLGQTEQATAVFEEYRTLHPDDERAAEIAYQLSDIHDAAGNTSRAIEEVERALRSNPTPSRRVELHYRLGLYRETGDDLEGAMDAYRKAIGSGEKANAYRLSALARAAAIHEQRGDLDDALAAYRDLMTNASDPELVAAAEARATQLASTSP